MSNNRRVLIFSTSYFPFVGGAEVAVKEITNNLSSEFEFDLITAKLDKNLKTVEKIGAVTVYRIGLGMPLLDKFFLPYFGAWKAWKLHDEKKYICFWGIMVTFATGSAFIVNIFRKLLGRKKVPMILTLQEGDSEKYLKSKWFGLINLSWRLALRRTDYLTAISSYLLSRASRLGFRGRGFVIPNGVDFKKFGNLDSRKKTGITTIITTSRLVEKNGVEDIIKAMKYLPDNVELKILGIGHLEKSLKFLTSSLQFGSRVHFVGHIDNEELPKYLHQADIFIRPSLSEGQGISFIEAMASGLPVIATPVGGIVDFLEDGKTGLFCKVHDPESIAKTFKRLVEDENLRKSLTNNAKKMVREKYDWNLIAEEMKRKVFDNV